MVAFVQSKYLSTFGGSGAGFAVTFDVTATTGNAICITMSIPVAITVTSVTTSTGQTLALDKAAELTQNSAENIYFYSLPNITGTPTGVTVVLSADTTSYCFMEEVSGMPASSHISDDPARVTGGSGTAISAGITTTTSSAYVRALATLSGLQTATGANGFTLYPGTSLRRHALYDVDVGASGSKTIEATISGPETWAVSSIVYKNAGSGPTSIPPVRSQASRIAPLMFY